MGAYFEGLNIQKSIADDKEEANYAAYLLSKSNIFIYKTDSLINVSKSNLPVLNQILKREKYFFEQEKTDSTTEAFSLKIKTADRGIISTVALMLFITGLISSVLGAFFWILRTQIYNDMILELQFKNLHKEYHRNDRNLGRMHYDPKLPHLINRKKH